MTPNSAATPNTGAPIEIAGDLRRPAQLLEGGLGLVDAVLPVLEIRCVELVGGLHVEDVLVDRRQHREGAGAEPNGNRCIFVICYTADLYRYIGHC